MILSNFLRLPLPWLFSHTFPRLCHAHLCFYLVWSSGYCFIILVCEECHHLVLLPPVDLFGVNHSIRFSSHAHAMARRTLSANFSFRNGRHICVHTFLAILHVVVWKSTHVSSLCLLKRNRRIIVLVSQPLIFSIVCMVHDRCPTGKAVGGPQTSSTRRLPTNDSQTRTDLESNVFSQTGAARHL